MTNKIEVPVTLSDKEITVRVPDSTLRDAVFRQAVFLQYNDTRIKPNLLTLVMTRTFWREFEASLEYRQYLAGGRGGPNETLRVYGFPVEIVEDEGRHVYLTHKLGE